MSLREAVETGDVERVHEVLAQGADPNNVDGDGTPPLHVAAAAGNAELAGVLLASGAVVDLPESVNGTTALHVAARYGHHDTVQTLLVYGANVGATTVDGITPLHLAAQAGHSRVIELLLASGADPEQAETAGGRTALHLAAAEGHHDAARLLIWSGADPNRVDGFGITPLMLAGANGHAETIRTLLMQGANVNAADQNGETPLMTAIQQQHDDVALLLLEQGADPNAQESTQGMTALHLAATLGNEALIRALLERGADLGIADASGATPIEAAEAAGQSHIAELLRAEQNRASTPTVAAPPPPLAAAPVLRLGPEPAPGAPPRPAPAPPPSHLTLSDITEVVAPAQRIPEPTIAPAAAEEAPVRRTRRPGLRLQRRALLALILAAVVGGGVYLWTTRPQLLETVILIVRGSAPAPPRQEPQPVPPAEAIPEVKGPINDYAQILDKASRKEIDSVIHEARKKAGAEIAVLTVDTTGTFKMDDFARRTAAGWGKDEVVSALLVVAGNGSVGIHASPKARALLSAKTANQLIKDEISPLLASRNFRGGLIAGTRAIKRVLAKEPEKKVAAQTTGVQSAAPRTAPPQQAAGGYSVTIRSNPEGAIAVIDRGAYVGQTPLDLKLPYGRHVVEIRIPGYVTQRERIWVSRNDMSYSFDMVPVLD